ncbi:FtsH protease activity modulator HflK [Sphingomonas sinipercae]|uniref:Protein HflK n=1 Tax=Sphingomonas sinipercae TaxID=2714944 RepID=A0A6G7ZQC2_9SPHN|nr:FtsH protease activity modulator HflK [Sphingomonas sinipercae]QIL03125.1 FtsH protease activity modulator HflK [Sphingomonas sinipercae]
MSMISGWGGSIRGLFNDNKGPWGSAEPGDSGEEPPRSPWGQSAKGPRPVPGDPNRSSLDDFLRRGRARFGGGGLPGRPDGSLIGWGLAAVAALWLVLSSMHVIAPSERGVVTQFGRYAYTLGPGVGLTLPWPIHDVQKVDVENIRIVDLGSANSEDLMLTGDQNIIDIAYSVRWSISQPELYLFELARPQETIRQVAESAMRAVVSRVTLDEAIGDKRSDIEGQVAQVMQQILNQYHAGVTIRGIAIKQADPPQAVNDAFKDVSAAQQDAQRYRNAANAYAQQLTAKAQGEATAFDKVYEQYKLSPEVTRRRMYYETMERVLSKVPKTIVESQTGVVPYLPLPAVKAQPAPNPGAAQ